jgi:hypothetical protein
MTTNTTPSDGSEPSLEKLTGFFVNTPPATSPMLFPLGPKPLSKPCEAPASSVGEQTPEMISVCNQCGGKRGEHWETCPTMIPTTYRPGPLAENYTDALAYIGRLKDRLAAQSAELERVKREAKETEEGLQLAFDQRPINGMSVTEAIKALITQLATERQARIAAEAFSSKIERGEVKFANAITEITARIAELLKGEKKLEENLADTVQRVLRELAEARNEAEQLRRAIQEADAQFEKVTWGYDGDCGTSRIINKLTTALTTKAPNYIVELKEWKERWADAWAIYRQTQPGTQERVHAFDLLESVYRAARQEESK